MTKSTLGNQRRQAKTTRQRTPKVPIAYFCRRGTTLERRTFSPQTRQAAAMATNTGAFFVGVGTTFAILAIGFGGGLMMARTAVEPRAEQHARAPQKSSQPVRVILPASAEPAQAPQPSTTTIAAPPPPAPPIKEASVPETTVEKVDTRKAEADERERKRYAERKARRLAERAKRKQQIEQGERRNAPVMAFGGDEPRQSTASGFFGN